MSRTVKLPPLFLMLLIATILPCGKSIKAFEHEPSYSWTNPIISTSMAKVSEEDVWNYWKYEDLKALDPWGDSESAAMDIVAIYEKEEPDSMQFRLDFLDLPTDVITLTHFAIDFMNGGTALIEPGIMTPTFDIQWDLMVSISGTNFTLLDSAFLHHPELLLDGQIDRQLDFIAFTIGRSAFTGWDGGAFEMQALTTDQDRTVALDRVTPTSTDDTAGRAKLILPFGNFGNYQVPAEIGHYNGFAYLSDVRPNERRGIKYLLDAVEKYEIPLTHVDFRIEILPGLEYLRINDRIRNLASRGLYDPLGGLGYGHFMVWQPDDVDAKAIEIAAKIRQDLELPAPSVFCPYEAMITPGDIQVIQDAGFDAMYALGNAYRYWFGWIDDWSDPVALQEEFETWRKVHVINGTRFVFDNRVGNYMLGAATDERWEQINWDEYSEYWQFKGTDQGLHLWWRRILQDMAIDPDQEQFFTIGTDINIAGWLFPDVVDWNFKWLASHPWIEVTTFSSILERDWTVIDHGNLELDPDELLIQYRPDTDCGYNAYFPSHYYGGVTDDRCPEISAGLDIEAYYDYIPYLRDGMQIQPARIMGDDQTPGSIIYETLHNLRTAPDNALTDLAWLSYLMHIGEQTWHDGVLLSDRAKLQANFLLQVNKLAYAANWADEAAQSLLLAQTQVVEQDLDLDGENEYAMSNDRVLAIFENDGGRLEYAFAYSTEYGPVQLVSPMHQYTFKPRPEFGMDYTNGEIAIPISGLFYIDGAFVDHKIGVANQYNVYDTSLTPSSLTFTSASFPLTKTFTLENDTIHAQYQIGSGEAMIHVFSFYVNRSAVYGKDWSEAYEKVALPGILGWQMATGGSALVNFEEVVSDGNEYSFIDSPARDEMREREDPSTYPPGHWYEFPSSSVAFYNAGGGRLSLILRASPIRLVYLPLVVR